MSEELILTNLIHNEEYIKRTLPFLRLSYFQYQENKTIFEQYVRYYTKYNTKPTLETLAHELSELPDLTDELLEQALEGLGELEQEQTPDIEWLVDMTEEFVQDRAIYNAIQESINIIDGDNETLTKHAIPDILKKALSISFDVQLGHDYLEDAEARYDFYGLEHARLPFDIDILNKITNGGIPRKTLNVLLGTANAGKSLGLIHMAAGYLTDGLNVLYVSAEMSEESIGNRIDANQFQIPVNDVPDLDKSVFMSKINDIKNKTKGRLILHEYPTSTATMQDVRLLLQELRLKKDFVPDVLIIDYINIMASYRVKLANTGSYFYIKSIAEEMRALAVETDTVTWTATQTNRSGTVAATDVDGTDIAESFGLNATADFILALIRTEELDALEQLLIKQIKSRYGNKKPESFVIGCNIDTMSYHDVDSTGQLDEVQQYEKKEKNKGKFDDFKI